MRDPTAMPGPEWVSVLLSRNLCVRSPGTWSKIRSPGSPSHQYSGSKVRREGKMVWKGGQDSQNPQNPKSGPRDGELACPEPSETIGALRVLGEGPRGIAGWGSQQV